MAQQLSWGIKTAPQHTTYEQILTVWEEAERRETLRAGLSARAYDRILRAVRRPFALAGDVVQVSATIGICRVLSDIFNRRVASQPSITGRLISIKIKSGVCVRAISTPLSVW